LNAAALKSKAVVTSWLQVRARALVVSLSFAGRKPLPNVRYWSNSGLWPELGLNGLIANDPTATFAIQKEVSLLKMAAS
jgi:hypothetical protein